MIIIGAQVALMCASAHLYFGSSVSHLSLHDSPLMLRSGELDDQSSSENNVVIKPSKFGAFTNFWNTFSSKNL